MNVNHAVSVSSWLTSTKDFVVNEERSPFVVQGNVRFKTNRKVKSERLSGINSEEFTRHSSRKMNRITNSATARLKQDYLRLKKDPIPYVVAEPVPSNILEWYMFFV